jgi:hypothetical protein
MNTKTIHAASAFTLLLTVLFTTFFQVSKTRPFGEVNPFGVDPYDVVGSFAFQGALLIGVLTYARALRLREDPAQVGKVGYIRRGCGLALLAIGITLAADFVAVVRQSSPVLYWEKILLAGLAGTTALTLAGAVAWALAFRSIPPDALPRDLTPADAIDDLWTLVRAAVRLAGWIVPRWLAQWVRGFSSDRLFERWPWIDPRHHPWRFACALGGLAGMLLLVAQLREGLPPSLEVGILVTLIFIGGELAGVLLGFALLGGYLGLRLY